MKKFIGFDLEIAKEIPEGTTDWKSIRPLGITCAAAVADDYTMVWAAHEDTSYADKMTKLQCQQMVNDLLDIQALGYTIVTWNGLQFDFDVLQEESSVGMLEMAMMHIDIMFHIFCLRGYPVGLNAVAKGMNLPGKLEGMSGALAPVVWKTDPELVIKYVIQDSQTTLDLAKVIDQKKYFSWTSKSGKLQFQSLHDGLLSVEDCLKLPLPDTSWMSKPMERKSFMEWMKI